MVEKLKLIAALAAFCTLAAPAWADSVSVVVSPASSAPNLGKVISANTGSTVFGIDSSGNITRISGAAVRITPGGTTTPTVTVTCNGNTKCPSSSTQITVTVQTAGATGQSPRTTVTQFTAANLSGTTLVSGSLGPATSLSFIVKSPGKNASFTFALPMQATLSAGSATGAGGFPFTVNATLN